MQIFYLLVTFVFGVTIGSFLNVVILRTHEGKSLNGRSACPHCDHQLAILDLVPIFSYLSLNGKCRYCHHKLSKQYSAVELTTAIAFFLISLFWLNNSPNIDVLGLTTLVFQFFVASVLIVVTVTDIRWGIIPDKIILPSAVVALLFQIFIFFISLAIKQAVVTSLNLLLLNLLTAFFIGLFFYSLIWITKGKGMGGGDFKLSIFIGLALSWQLAILAIFLGFLTGAIGSVMLLLTGKKGLKSSVPFGPFLSLGAAISLLLGNSVLEIYLKTLGL